MKTTQIVFFGEDHDEHGMPAPFYKFILIVGIINGLTVVTIVTMSGYLPAGVNHLQSFQNVSDEQAIESVLQLLSNEPTLEGLKKRVWSTDGIIV